MSCEPRQKAEERSRIPLEMKTWGGFHYDQPIIVKSGRRL